jgi:hypothetical protein
LLLAVLFWCISAADSLAIFPCGSVFSAPAPTTEPGLTPKILANTISSGKIHNFYTTDRAYT